MKSRSLIKSLLATTGCIIAAGSFLPATAGAQTAAPEMAQEQSAKDAPAGMDNIVVTARRREERLQDVPATVSAFGEQALRNYQVSDMTDLTGAVPNLIVNNTGGGVNSITPFIRGIGQDSFPPNLETPIGVYFDDVYLGRTQGALIDLLDMERIEVLRGPQGTLYGRNNTGGAIKYVPRAPSLTTTRVMADLKVGNFDRLDAQVSASIPAIPGVLGIRIDAGSRYQQGYLDGVDANGVKTGQHFNGHNRQSGRISALWQPADTLTVQLSADIDHDNSAVNVATPISCAGPANTNCSLYFGSAYKAFNPKGDQASYDSWGTTLKIGYDMGFADVKSVSAYRQFDTFNPSDLANNGVFTLPVEFYLKQHQLSQEFQFTSKSTGPFTWIGGLFYFSESIKQDTANFLGFGFANNDSQSTDSYAAYGEVGYEIVEGLKLTAGLRYTKEEKTIDRIGTPSASSANAAFNVTAGYKGSKVTPKLGLDWKVTPDMLAYAIYSKGFKGGGFASAWPATVTEAVSVFQPEDVTNYEAGLKTDWLDHRLRINLAGFYVNYNNLQQLDLDPQRGFVVFIRESRVYGGELELTFRPDSHWNFAVTGGMLNSKTTKNNNPNSTSTIVRYAPKFQGRFFGEYRTEIGSSGTEFFMSGDVQHTGAYSVTDIADTSVDVAGYTLINSSLGFEFENGRYRIALAGKNLGDKEYWRMGIPGLGRFYGAPREVYINFTYKM